MTPSSKPSEVSATVFGDDLLGWRISSCSRHDQSFAWVFSTSGRTASDKLGQMIRPQLEAGRHGVEVVGIFFFDDNCYALRVGDPLGERLSVVATEEGILPMLCDQCA